MFNKKAYTAILLSAALLSGCGSSKSDPAITTFKENLSSFETTISEIDTNINAIDSSDDSAVTKLLGYYDSLDAEFQELTTYEVPEQYSAIDKLSDMASEYMTQAVLNYHSAFEAQPLDENILNTANTYYSYAITYVNYIGQVLTGATVEFVDNTGSGSEDTPAEE